MRSPWDGHRKLERHCREQACWYGPIKFEEWILAPRGHGHEWQRVFNVGLDDRDRVWEAISSAAGTAVIMEVRDRGADGVVCGIGIGS
jgi:hypothetical protein